jgi:hypothetical protein
MSAVASAPTTSSTETQYPVLPTLFKHEHPNVTANPSKGVFGTLVRSVGLTSNNRLVLKPTQLAHERYEELGYAGVFGRYYRLAQSYLAGEKGGLPTRIAEAFRLVGGVRVLFFENIKRALYGSPLIPVDFEATVRTTNEALLKIPDLPEDLRKELSVFLDILDLRYDVELSNIKRGLREAGKPRKVGVVGGGTRRRPRRGAQTRRA